MPEETPVTKVRLHGRVAHARSARSLQTLRSHLRHETLAALERHWPRMIVLIYSSYPRGFPIRAKE